jgi:hypothetical protein
MNRYIKKLEAIANYSFWTGQMGVWLVAGGDDELLTYCKVSPQIQRVCGL